MKNAQLFIDWESKQGLFVKERSWSSNHQQTGDDVCVGDIQWKSHGVLGSNNVTTISLLLTVYLLIAKTQWMNKCST